MTIKNLPAGRYALKVFAVGYRRNDVYADFLDLGSPPNPTRQQIQTLNQKNSGAPMLSETVEIKAGENFQRTLEMREYDVYLITLQALKN